jgi:hypothetical protein
VGLKGDSVEDSLLCLMTIIFHHSFDHLCWLVMLTESPLYFKDRLQSMMAASRRAWQHAETRHIANHNARSATPWRNLLITSNAQGGRRGIHARAGDGHIHSHRAGQPAASTLRIER